MAALGLTTWSQFALGSNTYGTTSPEGIPIDSPQVLWLPGEPIFITHFVYESAVHPSKYAGRGPAKIEGTLFLTGTNYFLFVADVQTQTERHASWVSEHALEVYAHVNAGAITGAQHVETDTASASNLVRVSFSFVCHDQRLYKASDDSVLLGS